MQSHEWEKYPARIIVGYYYQNRVDALPGLCRLVLSTDLFYSITRSVDEVTVMYDERLDECVNCSPETKSEHTAYTLLNVGSFLEESGLITSVATQFTENHIPIMYTTTFNNNYVLVPTEYEEKADKILNLADAQV